MACTLHAADQQPEQKAAPKADYSKIFKDDREKNSYAMGMNVGESVKTFLKRQEVDMDVDTLVKAFKDAVSGGTTLITEEQDREVFQSFQRELQMKATEKRKALGEKNKKDGEAFLAENKSKSGVITTESGLQYKVLTAGKGETAKEFDTVSVNYRGTLIDGTEFDSSYKRGQPFNTQLKGVIRGWTEALQLMKVGDKWQLFIPSSLAYGERGSGATIGPDAVLIFEVELLSVTAGSPPPAVVSQPLTSDIIKVPSAEELKKGAKIETIKPEDVEKEKAKELKEK
ncbi:MAG: FKBP-type peptidyl-prolyl cis-trans isomerase [Pedosphaera sp.]|nr:FKBP-type peptidyl-prolyl cis-trans isomerase [Pedosphaera sp.]